MELTEPLPFITLNDDETFHVSEEAAAYLSCLDGEISVVAIAGLYRTGKSYLLNQLLGRTNEHTMFGVGGTVNAMTKGIWIWGQPVQDQGKKTIIFMDTEGLGSSQRSQTQDTRIFALALLLSSFFIYNSRGVIDANAIEDLSLVVNLTKYIQVNAGGTTDLAALAEFFPSFLWVVRDFTLQLEEDGKAITPKDYLEKALKPQPGSSEDTMHKNQVRAMLASFFPDRNCITMVRPLNDENLLRELPKQPFESLRAEFRSQLETLHHIVFDSLKPKKLMSKHLSGSMLVTLAQNYVEAFNSGATPVISSAWDRVVAAQSEQALDAARDTFSNNFKAVRIGEKPQSEASLVAEYEKAASNAQEQIIEQDFATDAFAMCSHQLMEWMQTQLIASLEINVKNSKSFHQQVLERLYAPIAAVAQTTMDKDSPVSALHDTLKNYKFAMAALVDAYHEESDEYPLHDYVLANFLSDKAMDSIVEWGTAVTMLFRSKDSATQKSILAVRGKVTALQSKAQATADMLQQQKETFERALFSINERLAEEKMNLAAEIEHKSGEIARTKMQIERIAALHTEAEDRLKAELDLAKLELKEAEEAAEASRRDHFSMLTETQNQRLEKERAKNAKEQDLMQGHQALLEKVIALERELGDQQADQMLATYKAEQACNQKIAELSQSCDDLSTELKTQTIAEIRSVKAKHEGELKALQVNLNERQAILSALQERLEAKRRQNLHSTTKTSTGRKEDCVVQ
ncbi:guanylate-binding protein [Thraustotheca clavata]|uniref:Guanylate-binding protein n=1 Tax=Thraustotheca clavata TaxID=74557 RepID=A0A1V9YUH8_9STRA|nr:guanylate-binding protein [Thraustotheca clavata]